MKWISSLLLGASNPLYGGQAVIGGVMMKGKKHYAISVNTPSGLQSKTEEFHSISEKIPFLKWPFLRGVVNLVEMMILGYKSMDYAADKSLEAEEQSDTVPIISEKLLSKESDSSNSNSSKVEKQISPWMMVGTFLLSLVLAIGLFKFLPLLAARGLDNLFNLLSPVFNLVDGVIKLGILFLYLILIAQIKDIKDVFRYHGAEHKTINCYEAKKPLTVKNISSFTTVHKRCGTTFIFVVIFLSILVYMFIPKDIPFFINLALRLALLPLIASIGYEIQRFGATHSNFLINALVTPGLLLQKITTNEPSPKHIRAAKAALEEVIKAENN
ncbi:DUF1385 domain-containing protein [Candidatus Woesearchaeota archaeon]|nr:DUF1385 domain-containing protein [Candidatus Woesearchaeota archaeon]